MQTENINDLVFDYTNYDYNNNELIELYKALLIPRLIEEKMLILLRQGKISKWFSGIGQEAISVGVATSISKEEYILPMHRNLGVFTTRGIPLKKLFAQWMGKETGFTKGRDRSFHFGTTDYNLVGMISHLGPQLGVANGIALAEMLEDTKKVTVVFTGDGATSEGDFHEGLNVASVWDLPVIFCVESNGYGLSTPSADQFNIDDLSIRADGYGMEKHIIDGNNILEVYKKFTTIVDSVRENPHPVFVEFKTFRRRGHEEASGIKYVPKELIAKWEERDPISNFENYLLKEGVITPEDVDGIRKDIKIEINTEWKLAEGEPFPQFNPDKELGDIYKNYHFEKTNPVVNNKSNIRLVDAISNGLRQSMQKYDDLVVMGQDIAEYGGVFKITDGFVDEFGKSRVRNTPICESIILSAALGLSVRNIKSVVEMQFADFATSGFTAIVNNLAKTHYRWGKNVDVVVRMPTGAGVQAGPFHSQSNESWYTHTPGLKVVYPAFPNDAKGLLSASIEDPNPVMFFEHKGLYRSIYGDVTDEYFTLEIGKANILKQGDEITIISYGLGVHWSLELLEKHSDKSVELIDLRTLVPMDKDAIKQSVAKTGKVLIVQEDVRLGGIASDISSWIMEECFEMLDAPVRIVSSLDTPVPFNKNLEDGFLAKARVEEVFLELYSY